MTITSLDWIYVAVSGVLYFLMALAFVPVFPNRIAGLLAIGVVFVFFIYSAEATATGKLLSAVAVIAAAIVVFFVVGPGVKTPNPDKN